MPRAPRGDLQCKAPITPRVGSAGAVTQSRARKRRERVWTHAVSPISDADKQTVVRANECGGDAGVRNSPRKTECQGTASNGERCKKPARADCEKKRSTQHNSMMNATTTSQACLSLTAPDYLVSSTHHTHSSTTPAWICPHPMSLQCFSTLRESATFSPSFVHTGDVSCSLARSPFTATTRAPVHMLPMFSIKTSALVSFATLPCFSLPCVRTPSNLRL